MRHHASTGPGFTQVHLSKARFSKTYFSNGFRGRREIIRASAWSPLMTWNPLVIGFILQNNGSATTRHACRRRRHATHPRAAPSRIRMSAGIVPHHGTVSAKTAKIASLYHARPTVVNESGMRGGTRAAHTRARIIMRIPRQRKANTAIAGEHQRTASPRGSPTNHERTHQ